MIPTVELHRHFEAGLSPETIATLAQRHGVAEVRTRAGLLIEGVDPQDPGSIRRYYARVAGGIQGPGGFARFVDSFGLPLSVLRTLDDLRLAAREQVLQLAALGSLHTELRGSAFSYRERVDAPVGEILSALRDGVEDAWKQGRASGSVIASFSRQKGLGEPSLGMEQRQAPEVVRAVVALWDPDRPLGLDVAGFPEDVYPPRMFREVLAPAREAGVPLTVHAGEQASPPDFAGAPPELVVEAVEALGARRIGHGTSLAGSRAARDLLRERRVGVECCPESNELLGFVRVPEHPLRVFLDEGLLATAGTDDPLMFGGFALGALLDAHGDALRIGPAERWKLAANGVETAFVSESRRAWLRERLAADGTGAGPAAYPCSGGEAGKR